MAARRTRAANGRSSIYLGGDGVWHGRVTMGVRDDGRPDRRHVQAKTRAEVTAKVKDLETERDEGIVTKPGQSWTVTKWLLHVSIRKSCEPVRVCAGRRNPTHR
jgi:hypothetical protein